ncbi:hypothetical protein NDU88_004678 [Pleurodeles waltl]|uniref:Uncharacterized protein n=1 Tax=Pleurodeles waltl TaxID=8319 RepID=A0AAV7UJR8_PLEWA|nr:hypothetical protein NDU88_004678 [Pleurodeles waltl]
MSPVCNSTRCLRPLSVRPRIRPPLRFHEPWCSVFIMHSPTSSPVVGGLRGGPHQVSGSQGPCQQCGAVRPDVRLRPAGRTSWQLFTSVPGPLSSSVRVPERSDGPPREAKAVQDSRRAPPVSVPLGTRLLARRPSATPQAPPPIGPTQAPRTAIQPNGASVPAITFEAPPAVSGQQGDMRSTI